MRDIYRRVRLPSEDQWSRLYSAAILLRDDRPWDWLWDSDIVIIELPGREEPIFCSVMGMLDACHGICVYPGYEALYSYIRMADTGQGEPGFISVAEQDGLVCYFSNEEELDEEDKAVARALGFSFRGPKQHIYFRSLRPGFQPWYVEAEDADLFADALEQLFLAVQQYAMGNIMGAHEKDKHIRRYYDEEKKRWINEAVALALPDMEMSRLMVDDELFIAQVNHQKRVFASLELDIMYLPMPVEEQEGCVPYYPQMGFLVDASSGELLAQHVLNPQEEAEEDIAMSLLLNYIFSVGRPIALYVRNVRIRLHVEDLCEKAGIRLEDDQGVPLVDSFVTQMLEIMKTPLEMGE